MILWTLLRSSEPTCISTSFELTVVIKDASSTEDIVQCTREVVSCTVVCRVTLITCEWKTGGKKTTTSFWFQLHTNVSGSEQMYFWVEMRQTVQNLVCGPEPKRFPAGGKRMSKNWGYSRNLILWLQLDSLSYCLFLTTFPWPWWKKLMRSRSRSREESDCTYTRLPIMQRRMLLTWVTLIGCWLSCCRRKELI